MDFDQIKPIRFSIATLKYLGLWRLDNQWESLYRTYSYILHFFSTFLTITSMWASVFTAKDFEQFANSLSMSLTEIILLAKAINIFYSNKEVVHFFHLIDGKDFSLKNSKEMEIFKSAHRVFCLVVTFYKSAAVLVLGAAYQLVALGEEWVLPYPAWLPFDLNSKTYWYAYFFQLLGMVVTCLTNLSIDMVQCYSMYHLSLIYRVIGYRLANVGYDLDDVSNGTEVNKKIFKHLTKIIRMHQLTKRLTTKCEGFMSFPLFMQIILSALVLCFTGYQIIGISPMEYPIQYIEMLIFLVLMGLQIFLPCYYAHQVTIQSGILNNALYSSNWTVLPQKSKKLICLYMEFLKEPVYVKAGKLFNIGLPIFSNTINNAYSCFAVLIRMKE